MERSSIIDAPTIDGYILIQARSSDDASELTEQVTRIPGVARAQRVNGPYDVIAEIRKEEPGSRPAPVENAIRALRGVLRVIPLAIGARAG